MVIMLWDYYEELYFLKKKLKNDPEFRIRKLLQSILKRGTHQKLKMKTTRTRTVNYLLHHIAVNINKPSKVIVAFDVRAKYNSMSLNKSLLNRPDLLNNLFGSLCIFAWVVAPS